MPEIGHIRKFLSYGGIGMIDHKNYPASKERRKPTKDLSWLWMGLVLLLMLFGGSDIIENIGPVVQQAEVNP